MNGQRFVDFVGTQISHVFFSCNIDYFHKQTIPLDENCNFSKGCSLKDWLKMDILSTILNFSEPDDLSVTVDE